MLSIMGCMQNKHYIIRPTVNSFLILGSPLITKGKLFCKLLETFHNLSSAEMLLTCIILFTTLNGKTTPKMA